MVDTMESMAMDTMVMAMAFMDMAMAMATDMATMVDLDHPNQTSPAQDSSQ